MLVSKYISNLIVLCPITERFPIDEEGPLSIRHPVEDGERKKPAEIGRKLGEKVLVNEVLMFTCLTGRAARDCRVSRAGGWTLEVPFS
jgi:hypothetical protein